MTMAMKEKIVNSFPASIDTQQERTVSFYRTVVKKNKKNVKISVAVVGSRGIPNIQGGIETHCEKLYPRMTDKGIQITIYGADSYLKTWKSFQYKNTKVVPVPFCFRFKGVEAFLRTFGSLPFVILNRPDIVHIHGIGPAFLAPLFRLCGCKVILTHHGQDYQRARWGIFAKVLLRLGERISCNFANRIIVISSYLNSFVQQNYNVSHKTVLIHNGVELPESMPNAKKYLEKYGLTRKKYIFACGRFVKEKGFHDLIEAFKMIPQKDYKLVLAGCADQESEYSKTLKANALDAGIILTGFIKGEELSALYANAGLFVIPSYHEGLPIALLEAMSYGLNIIASDIPANLEVPLPKEYFFPVGNVLALADLLKKSMCSSVPNDFSNIISTEYNWDKIADKTRRVYLDLIGK
jgi:glycosyltransferase involved in cell wall biosynthesis